MGSGSSPLTLEPEIVEGRRGLLLLVDITRDSRQQASMRVKCKLCAKEMAGVNERMAAHFSKTPGNSVAACTNATPESIATGKKFLKGRDEKRDVVGNKRGRSNESVGGWLGGCGGLASIVLPRQGGS